MKIRPVRAQQFHADGRTDRHRRRERESERERDTTKLTFLFFCSLAKAP